MFSRLFQRFDKQQPAPENTDAGAESDGGLQPSEGRIHVLIPGELEVLVADHEVDIPVNSNIPEANRSLPSTRCRSWLSRGLAQSGQAEVMIVFPLFDDTILVKFEADVFQHLTMMHHFASEGRIVNAGEYSIFEEKAPFDRPYCGIGYFKAPPAGLGPDVPPDALLALFLHPDECSMVLKANCYRVGAWLAYQYRMFPYPKVSDPFRDSVIPSGLPESMLGQVPLIRASSQAEVCLVDKRLSVRLTSQILSELKAGIDTINEQQVFGIVSGQVGGADSRLVWKPDTPEAVGNESGTISVMESGFVIFMGGQTLDSAMIVEDGFSVLMTWEPWSELLGFIETGEKLKVAIPGEKNRFVTDLQLEVIEP